MSSFMKTNKIQLGHFQQQWVLMVDISCLQPKNQLPMLTWGTLLIYKEWLWKSNLTSNQLSVIGLVDSISSITLEPNFSSRQTITPQWIDWSLLILINQLKKTGKMSFHKEKTCSHLSGASIINSWRHIWSMPQTVWPFMIWVLIKDQLKINF